MDDYYITGYVYFIRPAGESVVKIGSTINALRERLATLQTSNHKRLNVMGAIDLRRLDGTEHWSRLEFFASARKKEREIHRLFASARLHGEWFTLTEELADYIAKESNWKFDAEEAD